MQPTENQNIVTSINSSKSSLPSEAEFIKRELAQQELDANPVHGFLPLAELRADTIISKNNADALNEIVGKFLDLEKTWDFIVSNGEPIGVELMNSAQHYAIVLHAKDGGFKIRYFDDSDLLEERYVGPSSYEAFEIVLLEGFTELQPGILEFLMSLPDWKGPRNHSVDDIDADSIANHADLKELRLICMA